ncbi:zinc finger (c3hc4 ring finger) [Cystoisospora suis]|uniref:Zinc finger (C3hc4 ring finger) n=1 Tax=Cystoisospora suis TaxID=483139 RepID=A0A2C6L9U0_9APIC|nr:zinc finger (c3hc4 ring finger) [Cystoisospora suis]
MSEGNERMRVFSPYPPSSHQAASEQIRERTSGSPNIFMRAPRSLLSQYLSKQHSPSAVPSPLSPSLAKPNEGPRPSQVPKSRGEVHHHQSFLSSSSLPSPATPVRPPSRPSPARPSLSSAIPGPSSVSSVPPAVPSSAPPAPVRPSPAHSSPAPSSVAPQSVCSPRPSPLSSSSASRPPGSVPLASPRPSLPPHTSSPSVPSASRSHQLPRVTSSLGPSGRKTAPHAEEDEDVIVCLHQEPQQHSQVFRGGGGRGGEARAVPRGPPGASPNFHKHTSSLSSLSLSPNGLSKDSSPPTTAPAKAITPASHVQPATPLPAGSPALSNPPEKKPLSSSSLSSTLRKNEAPREERSQATPGVRTVTQSSSPAGPTRPAGWSQSTPSKNTAISSPASPNKLPGVQDGEGGNSRGGGEEEESLTTSSSSKKLREQRHGGGVPRKRKLDGSQASSSTSSRNLPLLLLLQGGRIGGGDGGDLGSSLSSNVGFSPPGIMNTREQETNRSGTPSTSSSPSVPNCNNPHAPTLSPSSSTPQSSSDSPPLEGQCEVFEGEEGMDVRFTVRALQSNLKCRLCGGFFREAVTIKDCLHTFCKWCLYIRAARQDLEETGCPRCEEKLRHSLPHTNGSHYRHYLPRISASCVAEAGGTGKSLLSSASLSSSTSALASSLPAQGPSSQSSSPSPGGGVTTSSTTSTQLSGSAVLFDRALQSVVDKLIPYFSLQENLERDELYRFLYLQKDEQTPKPEGLRHEENKESDHAGEVIPREGRCEEHQGDKLSSLAASQLQMDARPHVKGTNSSAKQKNPLHGNPGEEEQQQQEIKDKCREENFSLRDSAFSQDVKNGDARDHRHLSRELVTSNHHERSSPPSSRVSSAQQATSSSSGERASPKEGGEQSPPTQTSHISGQRNEKQGSCSISDPKQSARLLSSSPLRHQDTSTTSSVPSTSCSSASLSRNGDSETHTPSPSSGQGRGGEGEKKKMSSCKVTGDPSSGAHSSDKPSLQRGKEQEEEDTQAASSPHESGCGGGGVISGTPSQLLQAIEEGSLPLFDEEKTVAVALLPEEVRAEILLYSLRNRLYQYLISEEEKSLSSKKKERTFREDNAKKGESSSVSPASSALLVKKNQEEEKGKGKAGEDEAEQNSKKKNEVDHESAIGNRSGEAHIRREGAQIEGSSHEPGALCGDGSSRSKNGDRDNKTGRRTAESGDDDEEREKDEEKKQRKKRVTAMTRLFSSLPVLSRELEKARRQAIRDGGRGSSGGGEQPQLQGMLFLSASTSVSPCLARPYLPSASSSFSPRHPPPPPLFWPLCLPRLPLSYLRVNRRMTVQHLLRYLAAQLMSHLISAYEGEGEDQDMDGEEDRKKKTRKTTPELSSSSSSSSFQSDEVKMSSSSSHPDVKKEENLPSNKLMKTDESSCSSTNTLVPPFQPSSSSLLSSSASSSPPRQHSDSIPSPNASLVNSGKVISSEETKQASTIPSSLSPHPLHHSSSVHTSSMQEGSSSAPLSSSLTTPPSSSFSTRTSSSLSCSQSASSSPPSSSPSSSAASSFLLSLVRDREYQKHLLTELEGSLELTLEGKVVGRSHSLQFLCKARRLPLLSGKCLLLAYQWNAQAEARRLQEAFEILQKRLGRNSR